MQNLDILSDAGIIVEDISEKIRKCTEIVNELAKRLALPGSLSQGVTYGFVVIDVKAASQLRDRIGRVTSSLKPFCKFFQEAIEQNAPFSLILLAATLAQLRDIYQRQIAVLNSTKRFGSQAQTLMTNATQRIS
ncbi:hypothetical protein Emed_004441 [Eimeria media]